MSNARTSFLLVAELHNPDDRNGCCHEDRSGFLIRPWTYCVEVLCSVVASIDGDGYSRHLWRVARYAFHRPSIYAMDLTKILMIPALVLSVSYVHRYRRHLQVDFIATRLPAKLRLIVLDIIVPLLVCLSWPSSWYGRDGRPWPTPTLSTKQAYSTWAEPMWPVKLTIPIGYALLCIVIIGQLVGAVAQIVRLQENHAGRF